AQDHRAPRQSNKLCQNYLFFPSKSNLEKVRLTAKSAFFKVNSTSCGRGPSSEFFTHPGASANLTAQQWGCKQPRCVRLLRLWPTPPFLQRTTIILRLFEFFSRIVWTYT
ncbi:MAG: hypothetical protein IIT53_13430, partial [Fibrobacter sp.]|nr:hypothetical protein [Fibrobacter sp.]